jgi:beta-lactam-binding protein with PASTA domain
MDSGDAKVEITARGLAPQVVFGGSNCQIYAVVGQEPAAGSAVARGSGVTLTVCPAVTVPDVRGINKDTAAGTLQSAGLTPVFAEKTCDGSKPSGQVWTTEPGAGAAVSPGTTVTVFFYEGCGDSSDDDEKKGGDFKDP